MCHHLLIGALSWHHNSFAFHNLCLLWANDDTRLVALSLTVRTKSKYYILQTPTSKTSTERHNKAFCSWQNGDRPDNGDIEPCSYQPQKRRHLVIELKSPSANNLCLSFPVFFLFLFLFLFSLSFFVCFFFLYFSWNSKSINMYRCLCKCVNSCRVAHSQMACFCSKSWIAWPLRKDDKTSCKSWIAWLLRKDGKTNKTEGCHNNFLKTRRMLNVSILQVVLARGIKIFLLRL